MSKIICGFPGVGKSTLFHYLTVKGYKILDSDSSKFPKDGFPTNYIDHIEQAIADGNIVLVSTHTEVRKALAEKNIDYILVRPACINQKEEYLERYRQRGSPVAFVELMDKNWTNFYTSVETDPHGKHFTLEKNEFLDKIIPLLEK